MATAKTSDVRLNDLDWELLEFMSDGQRYTPAYLYNDVEALDQYGSDWIRRRIKVLNDNGLIEKVGTSSMYEITPAGHAALDLQEQSDSLTPQEFGESVFDNAAEYRNKA